LAPCAELADPGVAAGIRGRGLDRAVLTALTVTVGQRHDAKQVGGPALERSLKPRLLGRECHEGPANHEGRAVTGIQTPVRIGPWEESIPGPRIIEIVPLSIVGTACDAVGTECQAVGRLPLEQEARLGPAGPGADADRDGCFRRGSRKLEAWNILLWFDQGLGLDGQRPGHDGGRGRRDEEQETQLGSEVHVLRK